MKLRMIKGGLRGDGNVLIAQGEIVPDGFISDEQAASLVERGLAEDLDNPASSKEEPQAPEGGPQKPTRFDLNPDDLKGKKLDELNVMLAERDQDPVAAKADAIKILTKDFKK